MKEMRLLRDLRHNNVNSFIGATIEPLRILIVTDYCAKGSLYVSLFYYNYYYYSHYYIKTGNLREKKLRCILLTK